MDAFARLEVWSDYPWNGGTRQDFVSDLVDSTTTLDVTGDESVTFSVLANSRVIPLLIGGAVIGQLRRNAKTGAESMRYWRISERTQVSGDAADTVSFTARPPHDDLARGEIFLSLTNGETAHALDILTPMSPADIIDTYVLPAMAAAGLTGWARGTVEPTTPISLSSLAYENALSLLNKIIAHPDVACELDVRPVGNTVYIDLVAEIGAAAERPTFALSKNLIQDTLTERTQDQVTRVIPKGAQLPGLQEHASLKRILGRVSAVTPSGGNLLVTIEDPDPDVTTSLIAFDDEFTGWYLFRQLTGVTFAISACNATTQQLTIPGATYPTTLAAGELIEFRRSDDQSQRVGSPLTSSGVLNDVARLAYVKAIDGVQLNRITLQDAGTSGTSGTDMVTSDGLWSDLTITFCTQILSVTQAGTALNAPQGRWEFPSSIATLQVGDLVYSLNAAGSTASPPHTNPVNSPLTRILSIDLANNYAYVEPAYTNAPSLGNSTTGRIVVIRPDAATRRQVQTSNAANNTVDLTENAPAVTGKIALIEQWSSGVFPSYVEDPVAVQPPPNGYGIIARPLDQPDIRGEANVLRNGLWKRWTTPSSPPDGWTVETVGINAVEHSQNTDPSFIRFGAGRSWHLTLSDGDNLKLTSAVSPRFGIWPVGYTDLRRLAIVVSFYLEAFANSTLKIGLRRSVRAGGFAGSVDQLSLVPSGDPDPKKNITPGAWYQFPIPAIDLPVEDRFFGASVVVSATTAGAAICKIYLDAVGVYQVEYDPGTGNYIDGAFPNRLLARGHQQLRTYSQPTREFAVKILDLERITGDEPITRGGRINLRNPAFGSSTPRVTRMAIPDFDPTGTQITLQTTPAKFTSLVAAGA